MHRRVHDDDVGALADPLEVGDLQSRDLRLGFLRVAHHALELARKLLQPESTTRLLVVTVRIAMKRTLCILSELMAEERDGCVRHRDELVLGVRGQLRHAGFGLVLVVPHVDQDVALRGDLVESLRGGQVT